MLGRPVPHTIFGPIPLPSKPLPEPVPVERRAFDDLVAGRHQLPHAILGAHLQPETDEHAAAVTVRTYKPLAKSVVVKVVDPKDDETLMVALDHEYDGVWVGVLPVEQVPSYRLLVTYDGHTTEHDEPYRFWPTLSDFDLHLIDEGRHERLWDALGARVLDYPGLDGGEAISGTSFTVWAPHAVGVRLKGDFNAWDGREHPMRRMHTAGVWELFVPGVGSGAAYKFDVLGADAVWREKADPMAAFAEVPPKTSSVVFASTYTWGDEEWMSARTHQDHVREPMSVYEVHLGSWRRGRSYRDLADELVAYVKDLGFTHVELMPVMQHPFGGSWGYHVTGYYGVDSRFGTPDDLRFLIDRMHQAGIGVILDWVPGHFATDPWALARFDGTALYEDPDPQRGWHSQWGSHIFAFGNPQVRNFLVSNAVYWAEELHADGLRVDGVASMLYLDYARQDGEWTPNIHGGKENLEAVSFLQEMNSVVYRRVPGVMVIAEESTAWPGVTRPASEGGLGFGFKWNMGWMHDSLSYLHHDPADRPQHHHELTFALTYAWAENYLLPLSHDEVVHGKGSLLRKMPGDRWRQLANLRAYFAFMWAHPGKQLLFMGGELGQEAEWAEQHELDWWLLDHPEHSGLQSLVRDLNARYRETPAIWMRDADPGGFVWLDVDDAARSVYAFVRYGHDTPSLVCVANFSATPVSDYVVGLPATGVWDEIVNTDATSYTGSGVGNLGTVEAVASGAQGQPASAVVTLPPLATVWFKQRW